MSILTRIKVWVANRSLLRVRLEAAAARDYLSDLTKTYEDDDWSDGDFVVEIRHVRDRIAALEEEEGYLLYHIADLKGELPTSGQNRSETGL